MFEIGNSLREARTRKGLDFPELEQGTKIRVKYLRALEDESFETLPSATYVKGFLRTYADYLGLDGQLYVDEYNVRYGAGEEVLERRVRGTASSTRRPHVRKRRRLESRLVWLTLMGIAVVTALVIAAWKFGGDSHQRLPLSNPATQPAPRATLRATHAAASRATWPRGPRTRAAPPRSIRCSRRSCSRRRAAASGFTTTSS